MMGFYVVLWIAITLTCVFVLSIISYCLDDNLGLGVVAVLSGSVGFIVWIIFMVLAGELYFNSKYKYEVLLKDKIKAERNIEKHLIDNPELRELEIDENGRIKEVKEK